jgi:transposase-like protein
MAAKNYPQETKQEALELLNAGFTSMEVAQQMGISDNTIRRWKQIHEQGKKRGYDTSSINRSLLELAGDNDLSAYVGKEITRMSLREIITFLRLLGVKGKLTIEQTLKL